MKNPLISHRSIRNFKTDKVSDEIIENMMLAGIRASNTGNMQAYCIIKTEDKIQKEKLWVAHFKQQMVLQAPLILTFCADFNRINCWCQNRKADAGFDNFMSFFTGATDALLSSQNVAVAAEMAGLGICYLGTTTYNADQIIDILELPKGVVPVTTLVVGYPADSPALTDRLPLEAVMHVEKYHDFTADKIDQLYAEKENLPLTKALLEVNKKETLAQIFTDNRYTRRDNEFFSDKYLSAILNQGFNMPIK